MPGALHKEGSYQHYYKSAPPNPQWRRGLRSVLVDDLDKLKRALEWKDGPMALDTEADSLVFGPEEMVGFSFSHFAAPATGFYVPIRHRSGPCLPPREALDLLVGKMKQSPIAYWNYLFDMRMLEHAGYCLDPRLGYRYVDVMVATWLLDTNWKRNGLKWAETHFLGWDAPKFEEVLGKRAKFGDLDASDPQVLEYPCLDAMGTAQLGVKLLPIVKKEQPTILRLDNQVLYPLAQWMSEQIEIDVRLLGRIETDVTQHKLQLESEIYAAAGGPFNIGSSQQLIRVFEKLGIHTGSFTEKTKDLEDESERVMSTGKKALEGVEHPFAAKVVEYRSIDRSITGYVRPLREAVQRDTRRFSYKPCNAPTGRFAGGDESKNPYFASVSIHNIPKPKSQYYYLLEHGDTATRPDAEVLGHRFLRVPKDRSATDPLYSHEVEGMKPEMNLRRAFYAPEGWWWASLDYSGEELRLAANLSGERKLIKAYLEGRDPHAETCQILFGKVNSDLRKIAKIFNFAVIYGASEYGLSFQLGRSVEECKELLNKFQKGYPQLFGYIMNLRTRAMRNGYATTFLGRPRRLRYWYAQEGFKAKNAGHRRAFNHEIQGTAAEVLKIGLLKIYEEIYRDLGPQGQDLIRWRSQVHDEVNFIIRKEAFEQVAPLLLRALQYQPSQWLVPLVVGLEVGDSWGSLFPFEYDVSGNEFHYTPAAEAVRQKVAA
jgi:DNA polymerase-1